MDAGTGEIVATALTTNDVDYASQIDPLFGQLEGPVASLTEHRRRAESLPRASLGLAGCPAFD
jgi:hypothetical protein